MGVKAKIYKYKNNKNFLYWGLQEPFIKNAPE